MRCTLTSELVFKALFHSPRFRRECAETTALEVVGWWESRRFFYNVVVGCTGLASCILVVICAVVSEATVGESIGLPDGPLLGVFAIIGYGILANVCYTAGWITELFVRSMSTRDRSTIFTIKTFRFGVQFSVVLTLLPALFCWIAFAVMAITGYRPKPGPE